MVPLPPPIHTHTHIHTHTNAKKCKLYCCHWAITHRHFRSEPILANSWSRASNSQRKKDWPSLPGNGVGTRSSTWSKAGTVERTRLGFIVYWPFCQVVLYWRLTIVKSPFGTLNTYTHTEVISIFFLSKVPHMAKVIWTPEYSRSSFATGWTGGMVLDGLLTPHGGGERGWLHQIYWGMLGTWTHYLAIMSPMSCPLHHSDIHATHTHACTHTHTHTHTHTESINESRRDEIFLSLRRQCINYLILQCIIQWNLWY